MAMCAGCHRGISPSESKRAKVEKDDAGRVKAVFHYKCWFKRAKIQRFKVEGRGIGPDAYEMSEEYRNRDDLRLEAVKRREVAEERYAELLAGTEPVGLSDVKQAENDLALAQRQVELAEDRMKESAPSTEGDWRSPVEKEI